MLLDPPHHRRRSYLKAFTLRFSVVLVMLSFQINLLGPEFPLIPIASYAFLLASFIVVTAGRFTPAGLLAVALPTSGGIIAGSSLKGFGLGVGAFLGFLGVRDYERDYRAAVSFVLFVTLFVVILQFLGAWEPAYRFADYGSEGARAINFKDSAFGQPNYLPQFRPSGVFPSPTYASAFAILLYSTVLSAAIPPSRTVMLAAAILFSLLGSSVGVVLVLVSGCLSFARPRLRYFVGAYAVTMLLYAYYLPAQFHYNYNINEFVVGFVSRLDLNDPSQESVFQRNWIVFSMLVLLTLAFVWVAARIRSVVVLAPPISAIALPILVHDLTLSLFYWFVLGAVVARVKNDGLIDRVTQQFARGKFLRS